MPQGRDRESAHDDATLVARTRSGNRGAFDALVSRHEAAALRFAESRLGDREAARDVVQEALIEVYLSLASLGDDARFGGWLLGIVRNLCHARIARRVRRDRLLATWDEWPATALDPSDTAAAAEYRRLFEDAVRGLTDAEREVVRAYYGDDRAVGEIADSLAVPPGAIKARLHRARTRLRGILGHLREDFPGARKEMAMVPVRIADVVVPEVADGGFCGAILHDEPGGRLLMVGIDPAIGRSIALALRGRTFPRPLTYDLMRNLVAATGAEIEHVRIESLRETTFYAVVRVRVGGGSRDIDARPSDAMALAAWSNRPVFASDEVLATAGIPIPEERRGEKPPGSGIDRLVREWDAIARARRISSPDEIIAAVFGGG